MNFLSEFMLYESLRRKPGWRFTAGRKYCCWRVFLRYLGFNFYKFLITIIGGLYILYLGISMITSDLKTLPSIKGSSNSNANSFINGLVTNIFNVKAFLFFISLFTILIDGISDFYFYVYPIYFAITSCLWFMLLSFIVTVSKNKNFNIYSNKYVSFLMSFILCFIAIFILVRSFYEYF